MAKRAKSPRKSAAKSARPPLPAPGKSARPAKSAHKSVNSRSCSSRSKQVTLGTKVDRCVATLEGWRKECSAKLRRTILSERSKKARRKQFQRLANFCKKEFGELVALAARLDDLANPAAERAKRGRK